MKKATTLLLFIFLSTAAFSQSLVKYEHSNAPATVIGKVSFGNDLLARLQYTTNNKDTSYTFYFMDQNYKQLANYTAVTFTSQQQPLGLFYKTLKAAFLPENAPQKQVANFVTEMTLGDTDIMITNLKALRGMQVIFTTSEGRLIGLTEKQVDHLFGNL